MRNYISIFFTALLLSGLPACYYSDSNIYYVDPVAGDPPLLSVFTNLDTLYNPPVNDSLEVIYQVEIEDGEFYNVYADVGSTAVFESDSSEGSFWISPVLADSSGVDTLYMEFYYSSNSNSLVDKLGYEAFVDYLNFAIDFNLEGVK
jgi:hypothetical protein